MSDIEHSQEEKDLEKVFLSKSQVILRISVIIIVVECLIMLLLSSLELSNNTYVNSALDVILLVILASPLIHLWVIVPFIKAKDRAFNRLHNEAHTDQLTNLPNRRLIHSHLEKSLAGTKRYDFHGAVLLLDLDGFKFVNDTYGHGAGDEALITVGNRILSRIRVDDVVGRLGGDEFIILLTKLNSDLSRAKETSLNISEDIITLINEPIDFNGSSLNVGVSVGVHLFGKDTADSKTVIKYADEAMYLAKKQGKGKVVFSNMSRKNET